MIPDRKSRPDAETLATDLAVLGDDAGGEPQVGNTGAERAKATKGGDAEGATSGGRTERDDG